MPESEIHLIGLTCEIKSVIASNNKDALREIGSLSPRKRF